MASSSSSPKQRGSGTKKSRNSTESTTGVMDYLQTSLPQETLLELYVEETRGPFVCRAVLQQLSSVASQITMRLSCTGGAFSASGIQVWTSVRKEKLDEYLQEMHQWALLQQHQSTPDVISLSPEFAKGLQVALCSLETSPWTQLNSLQVQALEQEAGERPKTVTPEDLERYTQSQWDTVLHFLVGTTGKKEPPPAVVHFLLETNLMQPDPEFNGDKDDAPLVITQRGYDFMLQDNHQQVWHFVVQYLKSVEGHKKGAELQKEALLLLICLSFARVGEPYLASSLNKDSRVMTKDLALFGLLFVRKIGKATVFYPTRVAMQLVGSPSSNAAPTASARWSLSSKALEAALAHPTPHDSSHLAIIVQTNFQLCGYTTSELHVSMLGLFCDVHTIRRLPNVVFMNITRDSIKAAFCLGIQARQILRFLEKHAHPKLRGGSSNNPAEKNSGPIPGNVVDQIWLWDRERNRVRFTKVYQHNCLMNSAGEFAAVEQYCRDRGCLAYSSVPQQLLYIDYAHVERVQQFVRQWRAKTVARQQQEND